MLGYKITSIRRSSFQSYDYESVAILLLDLNTPYLLGTVFFNEDPKDNSLIPVKAEYEDPETGKTVEVTL